MHNAKQLKNNKTYSYINYQSDDTLCCHNQIVLLFEYAHRNLIATFVHRIDFDRGIVKQENDSRSTNTKQFKMTTLSAGHCKIYYF